jgi:chemotaxis-related protein WspD
MASAGQDASTLMLDRPVSPELLRERTAELALPKTQTRQGAKSVVIFRVGEELFALPTDSCQEVAENCIVHSLPHRRGGMLKGLVNVRGDLLLCVALEALLGTGHEPPAQSGARRIFSHLLVCKRKGDRFAFPVNEICGVYRYNAEDLRAVPATLANASTNAFTGGMLPWNGRTAACLDDELLFYALDRGLA